MIPHAHPLALVSIAAPEDRALLTRWEIHLQSLKGISLWSELHLTPGTDRQQERQRQIEGAAIVLLLLSPDFLASLDCTAQMEQALERSRTGTIRVIPIQLRKAAWQESPLAELTHWPPNGVPIMQWADRDAAWDACVQSLRHMLGRRISRTLSSQPSPTQTNPDWERMLRLLRRSYKELLNQSLHDAAWMELGLSARPDMVSNLTNLLYCLPDGGEQLLAPGTSMLDAFDEAEGELLILGAPGAGKSTLLLDLAQQLVGQSFADPGHPLPVIFRLSSWALGRPALANWMIEQLKQTYGVPHLLSEHWVTQGHLLPLLDGLDEMEEAARPACIAAINTYHQTHLAPLVVCSRQTEYEAATAHQRLVLQSAVIVQPLSKAQIEEYLRIAGPSFAGVQTAIKQKKTLHELATTPLMLSVLLLTYRGVSAQKVIYQEKDLEQQVWTDYVARQVAEKGNHTRYPLKRTQAWLSWLAGQMRDHRYTVFSAEYLQTDWLALDLQRSAMWLAMSLPMMIIGGCVGLLVFLLSQDWTNSVRAGLLGMFIGNSFSQQVGTGPFRATRRLSHERWVHFRNALLLGALFAASYGLSPIPGFPPDSDYSFFIDWIRYGSLLGLGNGLSFWIFQRLLNRIGRKPRRKTSACPSLQRDLAAWLTKMASPSVWQAATILGAGMGLSWGLDYGLNWGLNAGLSEGLNAGLREGLAYGLNVSIMVVLVHVILAGSMGSLRFAERIHWTWRNLLQPQHLRSSGSIAGSLFLFFTLSWGLSWGLGIGLSEGLSYGLSYGLSEGLSTGLSEGLSVGLSFWMLLGLYQGMKQEHVEDQDRQRFNQGIRHSLRNGLLLSLISTIIINTIGVLSNGLRIGSFYWLNERLANGTDISFALRHGLSNGLRHRLSDWLSVGLSVELHVWLDNAWILLPAGLVVIWALSGGLTVLHHYIVRWDLTRHHTFPWRAQAFLDDATTRILLRRVGGGYSFIHRRLQDYFANADTPPSQN